MQIGILSDSHIEKKHLKTKGYKSFLSNIKSLFTDVDHIIHAGDICAEEFLRDLEKIAPITYCRGNMDSVSRWPQKVSITLETIKIGVAHRPEDIMLFDQNDIRVFIHGHTHRPRIRETSMGVLVINPGSILEPRQRSQSYLFDKETHPRPSVAYLTIENGTVSAVIKRL